MWGKTMEKTRSMKAVVFGPLFAAIALSLVLFSAPAEARERTLLGSTHYSSGGFGGVQVLSTQFNGEDAVLVGGSGAWVINEKFYIGGGGYGVGTHHDGPMIEGYEDTPRLEMGYGGAMVGLILRNDDMIHLAGDVMIGGGSVMNMVETGYNDSWTEHEAEAFWFIQPMAHLEMNVTHWMRASFSYGYRSARDFNAFGMDENDLSGHVIGATIRFGGW